MMAGFAVVFVAAQLTPAGWVADAFALASLTISAIFVGRVVIDVAADLGRFFAAVNATSEQELRAAGEALSHAIAAGGVALLLALSTRAIGGRSGGGRPYDGPPPPGYVDALAEGGVLVRMPAANSGWSSGCSVRSNGSCGSTSCRRSPRRWSKRRENNLWSGHSRRAMQKSRLAFCR
jgi:hypothetical protein